MKRALVDGSLQESPIFQVENPGNDFEVAAPLKWVDVPDDTTTMDTWNGTSVDKYQDPVPTRQNVRDEAEYRLSKGLILGNGERWRCDPVSMDRISSMLNSTVWPKSFKTAAGADVTLTSQAEARIIFDQCDAYVTAVLDASKTIQNFDPIPMDYDSDARWPSDGS